MRPIRPAVIFVFLLAIATFLQCSDDPTGITPEALNSFRLSAPDSVTIGEPFSITVTAVGSEGTAPYTGFTGIVILTASSGSCAPESLQITNGVGSGDIILSGITESQVITATSGTISGSITLNADFMTELDGGAGDPANEAIPEIAFVADGANYSNDHPSLGGTYVSFNTIMLSFNVGTTVAQANTIINDINGKIVGGIPGNDAVAPGVLFLQLPTKSHTELSATIATLEANPLVETVVQDVLVGMNAIPRPNDGDPANWAWELIPNGPNWGLESMRVPQMWNFNDAAAKQLHLLGFYPPTVLIVDDGFAPNHPDLQLRLYSPNLEATHGTFMAGIIGAEYNNGIGVDGVCPSVDMMCRSVSVTTSGPVNPYNDRASAGQAIISGTRSAIQAYSKVINMSIGYNWADASIDSDTDLLAQKICAAQAQLFVNTFNLGTFSFRAPLFVVSGGNDSGRGYGTQDSKYNSPMCYAALELGIQSIIVVEAAQLDLRGNVEWWPFSSIGGHVSAPGMDVTSTETGGADYGSTVFGSSAATAYVSGLAAYVFYANPYLTSLEVQDLIVSNATPVIGIAAPFVDAWASVVDIDRLRGYEPALRMQCDIDDGTSDGNQRVLYKDYVDYYEEDLDGDDGVGDHHIDMSDFRRWRDWYLATRPINPVEMSGSANHPKKDVNHDGTVGTPAQERIYPRGDFNGDGMLDETATSYVPGVLGENASDLDVLRTLFDDPDYEEWELPDLVESGDVEVHVTAFIPSYGADHATVSLYRDGQTLARTRVITIGDPHVVITAPTVPEGYTITLDISGTEGSDVFEFGHVAFPFEPGDDVWLAPIKAISINPRATYLHVCYLDTGATYTTPINLANVGIYPGQYIMIDEVGYYDGGGGYTHAQGTMAVFSRDDRLLDESLLNRVPGAIDAGEDDLTGGTWDCGGEATDIPQDFGCFPHVIVRVPQGAEYLFIATEDPKYSDNVNTGGFGVQITRIWTEDLN